VDLHQDLGVSAEECGAASGTAADSTAVASTVEVVGFEEEVVGLGAASEATRWVVGMTLAGTTEHVLLTVAAGAVLASTARPMAHLPDRDQEAAADTLVVVEAEATMIAMVDATTMSSHGLRGTIGIALRVLAEVVVVGIRVGRRGLMMVVVVAVGMRSRGPGAGTDCTGLVGLHRR